jgi:hypothetical protein
MIVRSACWQSKVGAHLALQFQQQPLGSFLANARHLDQAPRFLLRNGLRQIGYAHARKHA